MTKPKKKKKNPMRKTAGQVSPQAISRILDDNARALYGL
jgi:hypothetical protein